MEKQIDLAADHGITGFLFDWYWYKGEKLLDKALEEGHLTAEEAGTWGDGNPTDAVFFRMVQNMSLTVME
jgi:hypothetical protein